MQFIPKIFDSLSKGLREDDALPYRETLDDYLDLLLPEMRPWSEDLREEQFFLSRNWLEVNDKDGMGDVILHIFNPGGEYMRITNGNVKRGSWKQLNQNNQLILDSSAGTELYDLAFLDDYFFILTKHGNYYKRGGKKYFVMGLERAIAHLTWREYIEQFKESHKASNNLVIIVAIIVLIIVGVFVLFSVF